MAFTEKPPIAANTNDFVFLEWFRKLQIFLSTLGTTVTNQVNNMATIAQADEQILDLEILIAKQATTQELLVEILLELQSLNETLRKTSS